MLLWGLLADYDQGENSWDTVATQRYNLPTLIRSVRVPKRYMTLSNYFPQLLIYNIFPLDIPVKVIPPTSKFSHVSIVSDNRYNVGRNAQINTDVWPQLLCSANKRCNVITDYKVQVCKTNVLAHFSTLLWVSAVVTWVVYFHDMARAQTCSTDLVYLVQSRKIIAKNIKLC